MGVKRKYLKGIRGRLIGVFVVAVSGLVLFSAESVVGEFIDRYRPQLEQGLSKKLGHPLLIGQYKGLRPWGVALGPTQLLAGSKDESTANLNGLNVQFAPISSLLSRRPVLVFTGSGAKFNLRRNKNGSYWVLGPSKKAKAPNIELRFILNESSKVFVQPSNIEINAVTQVALNLKERKVKGSLRLGLPSNGSLNLKGRGNWKELDFQSKVWLKNFRLKSLEGILPVKSNLTTRGKLEGEFQLGVEKGNVTCNGDLVVTNLNLIGGFLKDPLISEQTSLSCNEDLLQLTSEKWKYGLWRASIKGELPLASSSNMNLGLKTLVRVEDNPNTNLNVNAILPLWLNQKGIVAGDLLADFDLDDLSLNNLNPLLGKSLAGELSAKGSVKGPLSGVNANFSFLLVNPQFSRIRFQEKWQGQFIGSNGGGGVLEMNSVEAAIPASFSARFKEDWRLNDLIAKRLGGQIAITRDIDNFNWIAKGFRLDRLEVAIPPEKSFKRIFGQLSGEGKLDPSPFFIDGKLVLGYPRLMGLKLREAQLKGSYFDNNYSLDGELFPLDNGQISINAEGGIGGALKTKTEFKRVTPAWIIKSALQLPRLNVETAIPTGRAKDLGQIKIEPIDDTLDSQLSSWIRSVIAVSQNKRLQQKKEIFNPDDLGGHVNALIKIEGPNLDNLDVDLKASGEIWANNQEKNKGVEVKPFTAILKGPLQTGEGKFSFSNIPFALLSLFVPSPAGLTGMFGVSGRYRLGKRYPEVTADLVFNEVRLGNELLLLRQGSFTFSESILSMDVILQNNRSSNPIKVNGQVPFVSSLPIDLRIESHGDGIGFLDEFSGGVVDWKRGNADLRLLIRGTIEAPQANGFLVFNEGEIVLNNRTVKDINGTIVFDFNRVEVKALNANIGENGVFEGSGDIGLVSSEIDEKNPLTLDVDNLKLTSSFSDVRFSSLLNIRGSLIRPVIGGLVSIEDGSITAERSASTDKTNLKNKVISNASRYEKNILLPEERWNRQNPLVLFMRDNRSPASQILQSSIPKGLSAITLDNLKVNLGPRLKIVSPPIANFDIEGFVLLNGALDESINAKGLIRLLNGRVNLFTTTFYLDRREPNVAVFVPSMGLVPYIDVSLTSRVPDTIRDPSDLSSSDFVTNGSGAFGIGGSRFIKVEVSATGPADRLSENYELRSKPPIPQNELLGLIGGNSLASLFEGGDSTVFADVLNRSLITPVLGNISGAFSDRLQIALYPAYVSGPESDAEMEDSQTTTNIEETSTQLSSQQAWVTEMGIDLTDRISFSIQATPSREDIPPQGNLTYQLNQNLGLLGSFDQDGNWQSQLEIFFRY